MQRLMEFAPPDSELCLEVKRLRLLVHEHESLKRTVLELQKQNEVLLAELRASRTCTSNTICAKCLRSQFHEDKEQQSGLVSTPVPSPASPNPAQAPSLAPASAFPSCQPGSAQPDFYDEGLLATALDLDLVCLPGPNSGSDPGSSESPECRSSSTERCATLNAPAIRGLRACSLDSVRQGAEKYGLFLMVLALVPEELDAGPEPKNVVDGHVVRPMYLSPPYRRMVGHADDEAAALRVVEATLTASLGIKAAIFGSAKLLLNPPPRSSEACAAAGCDGSSHCTQCCGEPLPAPRPTLSRFANYSPSGKGSELMLRWLYPVELLVQGLPEGLVRQPAAGAMAGAQGWRDMAAQLQARSAFAAAAHGPDAGSSSAQRHSIPAFIAHAVRITPGAAPTAPPAPPAAPPAPDAAGTFTASAPVSSPPLQPSPSPSPSPLYTTAALVRDHMTLRYTPTMVSITERDGTMVTQNAASALALGVHGTEDRPPWPYSRRKVESQQQQQQPCTDMPGQQRPGGSTPMGQQQQQAGCQQQAGMQGGGCSSSGEAGGAGDDVGDGQFNYLELLLADVEGWREEVAAATAAGGTWSRTVCVSAQPMLRHLLRVPAAQERWHEVQISALRDPVHQRPMLVVAETDVTATVASRQEVARLQRQQQGLLEQILPQQVVDKLLSRDLSSMDFDEGPADAIDRAAASDMADTAREWLHTTARSSSSGELSFSGELTPELSFAVTRQNSLRLQELRCQLSLGAPSLEPTSADSSACGPGPAGCRTLARLQGLRAASSNPGTNEGSLASSHSSSSTAGSPPGLDSCAAVGGVAAGFPGESVPHLRPHAPLLRPHSDSGGCPRLNVQPRPALSSACSSGRPSDVPTLATYHEGITVMFADVKGFTSLSQQLHPSQVMRFLNSLFGTLDAMVDSCGVYKVETIGDCYMVAGGLFANTGPDGKKLLGGYDAQHAAKVFAFARRLLTVAASKVDPLGQPVCMRVGMHSGPAMSGVVGHRMPRYCLFGDTVNTASRLESTGQPGRIHVSEATRQLLPGVKWEATGGVFMKGKGTQDTYLWTGEE